MKFDITSTYNSADTLYLKDNLKKQHSITETWRDLDESELYIALGEMLDIKVVDGIVEKPNLNVLKEKLEKYIAVIDEAFLNSEFNHQMSGYHVFGQIRNTVKDMISGLYKDSAYVIRSANTHTTFEITKH